MKQISNSPDITGLDFEVTLDLSKQEPSVTLVNKSVIVSSTGLAWKIGIYSPMNAVYEGDFTTPDATGAWTDSFVRNSGFPKPFGSIEWGLYRIIVSVKDSLGNIHSYEKQIDICRPNGNKQKDRSHYGKAWVEVVSKCHLSKVFFEDKTVSIYKKLEGTLISSELRFITPTDGEGNGGVQKTVEQFKGSALVPVQQNGPGYQWWLSSVYEYDFGNSVKVRIKYIGNNTFSVKCHVDLSPIACKLKDLIASVEAGSCKDNAEAERIIKAVSPRLAIAAVGVIHPQAGIDPFEEIEAINEITGWKCDCCTSGLHGSAAISENGTLYDVVTEGGDVNGYFDIDGGIVKLHLSDYSYEFKICEGSHPAFTVTPSIDGNKKVFCLNIDKSKLVDNILTVIETNVVFKERLTKVITKTINGNNVSVSIDRKCLPVEGVPTQAWNYIFTARPLDVSANESLLIKYVKVGEQTRHINHLVDISNPASLKVVLDGLGIGNWLVSNTADTVRFSSNQNTNDIVEFVASSDFSEGDYSFTTTKTKTAIISYPIQDVMQAMINFVCGSIVDAIKLGKPLTIKILEAIGGAVNENLIKEGSTIEYFLSQFVDAFNQLVGIVHGIKQPDCDTIKNNVFNTEDTDGIEDNDVFLMFVNGKCRVVKPVHVARKVFDLAVKEEETKKLMCAASASCAKPICSPVSNLAVTYNATTQTLTAELTNSGAFKYQLGYRKFQGDDRAFLRVSEVVATNGITTTFSWDNVPAGTWEVFVVALCDNGQKSSEVFAHSTGCTAIGSVQVIQFGNYFKVEIQALPVGSQGFRVEIAYPNQGSFVENYPANMISTPLLLPIPAGVYGDFRFVVKNVCSTVQGWYSDPTPEVVVNIPAPATCPAVTDITVDKNDSSGPIIISAAKPVGGNVPGSYTIRFINAGNIAYQKSVDTPGDRAIFEIPVGALSETLVYSMEIVSNCEGSTSVAVPGGSINPNAVQTGNNLNIRNNAGQTPTKVTLKINDAVVFASSTGQPGPNTTLQFYAATKNSNKVELTICGMNPTNAWLTRQTGNLSSSFFHTRSDVGDVHTFTWLGEYLTIGDFVMFT